MAGAGTEQNSPIFSALTSPCSSPRVHIHGSPRTPARPSSSSSPPSPLPSSSTPPLTNQLFKALSNSNKERLVMGLSSGTVLKKKRPARIDIPVARLSFGFESPKCAETMDVMKVKANGNSVYCKRGTRRGAMEDRYSAFVDFHTDSIQAFFGVFDGHGGPIAAEFAAKNLHENIKVELMMTSRESEKRNIEEAVKNGYLMTDQNFLKEGMRGGACCVTALIQDHNLVISNAGDCRAVMSRRGVAESLTSDHRPSRKDERDRIQTLGGYVDCCGGVNWRVLGSLAVTRGIGDGNLKQWVIAEPKTRILRIKPDCEFLIIGSDGLWDKVSNQEAIDAARTLFVDVDKPDGFSACKQLVDLSIKKRLH